MNTTIEEVLACWRKPKAEVRTLRGLLAEARGYVDAGQFSLSPGMREVHADTLARIDAALGL